MIGLGFMLIIVGIILLFFVSIAGVLLLVFGLVLLLIGVLEGEKSTAGRDRFHHQSAGQPYYQPQQQWQAHPQYPAQPGQAPGQAVPGGSYAGQTPAGNAKICRRCGCPNEKWKLSCDRCKSSLG
jgi:hypothetical protein